MKKYKNIISFLQYIIAINLFFTNCLYARESINLFDKNPLNITDSTITVVATNTPTSLNDNTQNDLKENIINSESSSSLETQNQMESSDTQEENEDTQEVTIEELSDDEVADEKDKIDISKLSKKEIKELGRKLRTVSKKEQAPILEALTKLKENASPATSEILASIHENKTGKEAIDILFNIGTESSISGLAKLISNSNTELSNYILENIIKSKPDAEFITEELMANFTNKSLKINIINALGAVQGERAFYELKELLKSKTESEEIKILALENFMKFKNSKKELPLLRKLQRLNPNTNYSLKLTNAIIELENK